MCVSGVVEELVRLQVLTLPMVVVGEVLEFGGVFLS
jgi:hypothetical protein